MNKDKYIIEKELLLALYWGNEFTLLKIANYFNCHKCTIRNNLLKYDIPIRDSSSTYFKKNHKIRVGMKHTRESKVKISKVQIGKPKLALRGIPLTKEHKKKLSLAKQGEKHPFFNNWSSREPYGKEWSPELRSQIRKRDCYKCQECGYTEDNLRCRLSIHHIDFNKKNNNPDNLISLCKSCHTKTNFNRENWIEYYKQKRFGVE